MPKFRIVIEDAAITLREKEFDAPTMEDATQLAEAEEWTDYDSSTNCEIREDLSEEIK